MIKNLSFLNAKHHCQNPTLLNLPISLTRTGQKWKCGTVIDIAFTGAISPALGMHPGMAPHLQQLQAHLLRTAAGGLLPPLPPHPQTQTPAPGGLFSLPHHPLQPSTGHSISKTEVSYTDWIVVTLGVISCCHVKHAYCTIRGLLEKYPTFGREKETGLLGALDT